MLSLRLPAFVLALGAPALLAADPGSAAVGAVQGTGAQGAGQVTTMTFHERIIVRVPRLTGPPPRPVVWKERRGPKCIVANELAGALVTQPGEVDLVLAGNRRLRAKLGDDCEPLDFYSGFYLRPAADGRVCADRDVIRARSGRSCPIEAFKTLKAVDAKR